MARTPKIPKAQEAPGPNRPPHKVLLPEHMKPVFMMIVTCLLFGPIQIHFGTWGMTKCRIGDRDVTTEVDWMVEHGFMRWTREFRAQELALTDKGTLYSKTIGLDDGEGTKIECATVQDAVDARNKSALWATHYKVGRPRVSKPTSEELQRQLRAYRGYIASEILKPASIYRFQDVRSSGDGDDVDAGGESEGA